MINIYTLDNSEYEDFLSISKGCRFNIYVRFKNKFYQLEFYDIIRLTQDFESDISEKGYYMNYPNLILVEEVSIKKITEEINRLVIQKYFERIKPLRLEDIQTLDLIELN